MNNSDEKIRVALADDHVLLRNALSSLIDNFENCKVIYQASNGNELISLIKSGERPDVLLLDLNMPGMNGYETAIYLRDHYPEINVLMLTMYDSELALIRLLQTGVKGFLKKDIHPSELKFAINSVIQAGYYYSNHTTGRLINLFKNNNETNMTLQKTMLSQQELDFLKLACTDLTYKEVAQQMKLNPRSVDNLRDHLFTKLDVKSRVGLAMYSIKHGIVTF